MPLYEYHCKRCDRTIHRVTGIDNRDTQRCEDPCGVPLERVQISLPSSIRVDHRHQTKAVLADGSKVAGHFGREASKNKGRY